MLRRVDVRYRHYVITRFSLPVLFAPVATHLQPEWLSNRCDLFERYCVPSVAAQEARQFSWIILLSRDTPRWAVARLRSAVAEVEQAIIFSTLASDPAHATWEAIQAEPPSTAHLLITSRLDSDDAIAATYVSRVQQALPDHTPMFLNFTKGYQFDAQQRAACRHSEPSNPFITLVERWNPRPVTVFCRAHLDAGSFAPVAQLPSDGEWLMVFHGGNATPRRLCGPSLDSKEWAVAVNKFQLKDIS